MAIRSIQTLTLEYRVFDRFDGQTEAPPFSEGVKDDRNIYVFEVARLGIIPLRFGDAAENPVQPSAPSPRFLTWTVLRGLSNGLGESIGIGGAIRQGGVGTVLLEPVAQIPVGQEGIYLRRCIKIPQGGVLLVDNVDAPPDGPAIVRVRVQIPANSEQRAFLDQACCCKATQVDINLPDDPGAGCPENLSITEVNPIFATESPVPLTVTITGEGFSELGSVGVAFLESGGGPNSLPVANIVVENDNTITVEVTPLVSAVYDVFVGDIEVQDCFAVLTAGFRVAQA